MQLLTERGFNIHMYPMIQRRGRIFEETYQNNDVELKGYIKLKNGVIDFIAEQKAGNANLFEKDSYSRWNLRCYKFMDWLSTKVRKEFDNDMVRLNPELGLITTLVDPRLSTYILTSHPENIYNIIDAIKYPHINNGYNHHSYCYNRPYIINYKIAAKELGWEKQHLINTVNTISKCKFKTNYQIKSLNSFGKTTANFNYAYNNLINNRNFESMYNIENIYGGDKNCAKINFNTGFGICFLNNIILGGYQLIDDSLYNLSENTQLVYRQRFLTYNKIPVTRLTLDWVSNFLGLNTKNKTELKTTFKKIIKELSLISGIEIMQKVSDDHYLISKGVVKEQKILQFKKN